MKLSSKARFSLRILLHVAGESRCGRLSQGRDIADKQGINEPYLEQIMIVLKKRGLITTVRGRNGGYKLSRPADQITVRDVIESFETTPVASADATPSPEAEASEKIWSDLLGSFLESAGSLSLTQILDTQLREYPDFVI